MKDNDFIRRDVPMTKEEVRAIALAKLNLYKARHFVDVGAGSGSVAIEAKVAYPHLRVTALERHDHAVDLIMDNANHFGVDIDCIQATVPHVKLTDQADAFFVGGTGGQVKGILSWIKDHALDQAQVVMTFVTLEQFNQTLDLLKAMGIEHEVCQIGISKTEALGPFTYLKPHNPAFMICFNIKGDPNE